MKRPLLWRPTSTVQVETISRAERKMDNAEKETKKRRTSEQVSSVDAKRFKVENDYNEESSIEQMPEKQRWQGEFTGVCTSRHHVVREKNLARSL